MFGCENLILVMRESQSRRDLEVSLVAMGMNVTSLDDTELLYSTCENLRPCIVIIESDLPGESGMIAAAKLRARSKVGFILLADQAGQEDRLMALSLGVDHFMAKPVDWRELQSVTLNLARRIADTPMQNVSSIRPPEADPWTLHAGNWLLAAPNGASVELSSAEYQLLMPLLDAPGSPQSRDLLNARLGKTRLHPDNRSLDVLVSRIRRKVENGTGATFPLRSARGAGYVFTGNGHLIGAWAA